MNFKAKRFRVLPCEVCGYFFSDVHHVFAQASNGGKGPKMALCPNHHRYAGMVQAMIENGVEIAEMRRIAEQYFDPGFNTKVLTRLIQSPVDEVMFRFFGGLL